MFGSRQSKLSRLLLRRRTGRSNMSMSGQLSDKRKLDCCWAYRKGIHRDDERTVVRRNDPRKHCDVIGEKCSQRTGCSVNEDMPFAFRDGEGRRQERRREPESRHTWIYAHEQCRGVNGCVCCTAPSSTRWSKDSVLELGRGSLGCPSPAPSGFQLEDGASAT